MKDIIIESLKFLIKEKRVRLFVYVIMPNHIHLIWQIREPHILPYIQRDFLKFTSQQIIKILRKNNPELLEQLKVNAADRKYQVWEKNPLSVELVSEKVIQQKTDYIHLNPTNGRWKLCNNTYEYIYSSAAYYFNGTDEFGLFEDINN
jgi:putative transposase